MPTIQDCRYSILLAGSKPPTAKPGAAYNCQPKRDIQQMHHKMVQLQTSLYLRNGELIFFERSSIGAEEGLNLLWDRADQIKPVVGRNISALLVGLDPITFHFFDQPLTTDAQRLGGLNLVVLTLLKSFQNPAPFKIRHSLGKRRAGGSPLLFG